jgi:hypothetical protein
MTEVSRVVEQYRALKQEMEQLKSSFGDKISDFVLDSFKTLREQAPEITRIYWTQGTPSFNDGEPCYFSVHDPEFYLEDAEEESWLYTESDLDSARKSLKDAEEYSSDPESWQRAFIERYEQQYGRKCYTLNPRPYPSNPSEAQAAVDEIEQFFKRYSTEDVDRIQTKFDEWSTVFWQIPEDLMKVGFGDGVRVTLSDDAVQIEEYYPY